MPTESAQSVSNQSMAYSYRGKATHLGPIFGIEAYKNMYTPSIF